MSGERKGEKQEGKECPWCHERVKKLKGHHYPIPKNCGGTEIKEVCQSCDQTDHGKYPDELIRKLIDEIEGRRSPELDLFGEDPHAERKKLIKEALKRAEEEKKKQSKLQGGDRCLLM